MIQLGVNTVGNNKNDVPIFSLGARQPPSQALLPLNLQNKEGGGVRFHHMNDFNVYLGSDGEQIL